MEKFVKVDSILFDLDGTLWDASKTCSRAWNEALLKLGCINNSIDEEKARSFSGIKIETLLKSHFDFVPQKKHGELLKLYQNFEKDLMKVFGGELFPHVREVLIELSGKFKLFVVSNCLVGYIENFIKFQKLQNIFSDFESSGNTGLSKDENIKLIVDRNNLKNPVYVGDTLWDFEAAQKANIPFIHVTYGFGHVNNPDRKIKDFVELKQFIKK